jgi:hypothetical protein
MLKKENSSFVFVISVRNPEDDKVNDYDCIEAVLHKTVQSLIRQTYENIHIIIVCHRIPSWSDGIGDKVSFLNVSGISVFPPNQNSVRVDKGLKYIIGVLYAVSIFNPKLIMPMDSDDYVNTSLAKTLICKKHFRNKFDGYVINKGLHVTLDITPDYLIDYKTAYLIKGFDRTCGSCRIFKARSLRERIGSIDISLENKFSIWPSKSQNLSVKVPSKPVEYLSDISKSSYSHENSIVNILGRHINQEAYFRLLPLSLIGAAKGCGHGNHDGPKQGLVHKDKAIGSFSTQNFCHDFGLYNK